MNQPVAWKNHLPALVQVLLLAALVAFGSPWPEPVADGWDAEGRPIHWQWAPAALGAAVMVWLVAFTAEGVWSRVERDGRKRFNPLSLIDELFLGWQLVQLADFGVANGMPQAVETGAWVASGLAIGAAVWLELRRQPEPAAEGPVSLDLSGAAAEFDSLPTDSRWSYWSVQKAPHRVLFGVLGVAFVAGAVLIPGKPMLPRLLLLFGGLLVLSLFWGGLRASVTPRRLVLRAGFGLPLLQLPTGEITDVAVPRFDPLRDFGGLGIRYGCGAFAGVRAFIVGDRGVLVSTRAGKRYLIGADEPERLAAALDAVRGGPGRAGDPLTPGAPHAAGAS
jgi:hypothetical protein